MLMLRGRVPRACFTCFLLFAVPLAAACSSFTAEEDPPTTTDGGLTDAAPGDENEVLDSGTTADVESGPDPLAADYARAVLGSNPLRYFTFDDGPGAMQFHDSVANASALASDNGITVVQGALPKDPRNFAAEFSPSSYLACGDILGLQKATKFAVELWVNRAPSQSSVQVLVTNLKGVDGGPPSGLALHVLLDGRAELVVGDGKTSFAMTSVRPLPTSVWTHLAVSYDASLVSAAKYAMWIDGTSENLTTSGPSSPPVLPNGGALQIGRNVASPLQPFEGILDEVALYQHPLTDADIQRHLATLSP